MQTYIHTHAHIFQEETDKIVIVKLLVCVRSTAWARESKNGKKKINAN
jgi:hypothetical protein